MTQSRAKVTELAFDDEELARLAFPLGTLRVTRGIGSGLSRRPGDAPGVVWAVGDRGPNLKIELAVKRYGLTGLAGHADVDGAKVMPCPDIGPALTELHVSKDRVTARRTLPLLDNYAQPVSGFPPEGADARAAEPAFGLDGNMLQSDAGGADTEGLAVAPDGSFWVGEEYGPSLLRVSPNGVVLARWVPAGTEALFEGANYPVLGALPAIATRRRLNRGFEGLALSADGLKLYLVFQSPLAHPSDHAGRRARHVRVWTLDSATGALLAEHLYPLDKPQSFLRDRKAGDVDRADVKLCDLAIVGPDRLLVLERISETAKLHLTELKPHLQLAPSWSNAATRPTIEEYSASGTLDLPMLEKRLLFSTDDHPEVGPDLEGLSVLGDSTVLLVNDNDFGIEGVATRFWRLETSASFVSALAPAPPLN